MASGIQNRVPEGVTHFGAIRMRVTGSGNLKMRLISMDDIKEVQIVPLVMQAATNIQPLKLTNFVQQRARLEGKTTEMDETFYIQRIIVFVRPIFTGYPQ